MSDETEQKIMGAALKLFSEKGYKGATTLAIAVEAGVNDSTLFRRFKTKRNLYDQVTTQGIRKVKEDFNSVLKAYKFENSEDFFKTFIRDLAKIFDDNFEFIHLTMEDVSEPSLPVETEFGDLLTECIEKNIKDDKIDCQTLAFSIFSFEYMRSLGKYKGRTYPDPDDLLEKFINNTIRGI